MDLVLLDVPVSPDPEILLLSSVSGHQARLVAARLALEPARTVRHDELAEVLWPDRVPDTWATVVRVVVSKVRRWLAGAGVDPLSVLQFRQGGYRLMLPEGWSTDVQRAAAAIAAAERATARGDHEGAQLAADDAVARLAHPLLADLDGTWLGERRRALREMHVHALELLVDACAAVGIHDRAITAARQVVALEPFGERAHRRLMEALVDGGDRALALRAYDELADLLHSELGISPSADTEAIRDRLGHGERRSGPDRAALVNGSAADSDPGRFVGRVGESDRLTAAWQRVMSGTGSTVVLLAGEAGIGKSTLAAHLASQLRSEGTTVLVGRCRVDPAVPYEPIVDAIERELVRRTAAERQSLLDSMSPEIGWIVPSLASSLRPSAASGDTDHDRYRVFEAVTDLVRRLAAARPLAIVVDDVQWSTEATQLLLRHMIDGNTDSRVLVLLAERRPELGGHGLADLLTELRQLRSFDEIVVDGFEQDDVEAFIRSRSGGPVDTAALASIAADLRARSNGNPYFIGELLRMGMVAAEAIGHRGLAQLSGGILEIMAHHAATAGPDATAVFRALAVIGPSASVGLLREVTTLSEPRLLDGLDVALETGLIRAVEGRSRQIEFAHALACDAVLVSLGRGDLLRLHEHAGLARLGMRDRGADISPAVLAHHFSIAASLGHTERAVAHTLEAARIDLAAGAPEDAAARLEAALALDSTAAARCDVFLLLGRARAQQGDGTAADAAFHTAAVIADALGHGSALGEAALGIAALSTWASDGSRTGLVERALSRVGSDEPAMRIRLLGTLAEGTVGDGSWTRRQDLADEAATIWSASTDPEVIGAGLIATRIALWQPDQVRERLAATERVLAAASSAGDAELVVRATLWCIGDLVELGDRAAVDAALADAKASAGRLGMLRLQWEAELWEVGLAIAEGRLSEAGPLADAALAMWQGETQPDAVRARIEQHGVVLLAQGHADLVAPWMQVLVESESSVDTYRCAMPYILLRAGDRDEARVRLEALADDEFRAVPHHSSYLYALAVLAEVAASVGSPAVVARLRGSLEPHRGAMILLQGPCVVGGAVDLPLGLLAEAAGDLDQAESLLRAALELHDRFGARLWSASTSLALARVLFAVHGSAAPEALHLLDHASGEADAMGFVQLADAVTAVRAALAASA